MSNWDPAKHPRKPKGSAGGGEFDDKGGPKFDIKAREKARAETEQERVARLSKLYGTPITNSGAPRSLLRASRTAMGQRVSPLAVSVSRLDSHDIARVTIHAGASQAKGYNPLAGTSIKPAALRSALRMGRYLRPDAKGFTFKIETKVPKPVKMRK